ncbi:hypothetical protein SteCoe_27307 [Stentor coeruleus]|uniref:Uncharacterized protein n=1 Tax=Stentor coeruleus TaxID=5963 RepID=A0A1R2BAQ7_9CILI|nr:hypothetical protein SteCoe_27307 [Stentor coeruleus]
MDLNFEKFFHKTEANQEVTKSPSNQKYKIIPFGTETITGQDKTLNSDTPSTASKIKETMKEVMGYFKLNLSITIKTPLNISCFVISKNYSTIYFISNPKDHSSRFCKINLESEEVIIEENLYEKYLYTLAISKNEEFIYAGGDYINILKFDINSLELISELSGHSRYINKLLIDNSGDYLFSASDDHSVKIWDLKSETFSNNTLFISGNRCYSMDLSLDNQHLCVASDDMSVYVYEISYDFNQPGKVIYRLPCDPPATTVKISSNKTFLAIGNGNGKIYLYRFDNGELYYKFNHNTKVLDIDINNTEEILISAGVDSNVKIWDIHGEYDMITFEKHRDVVRGVVFMKDQERVCSFDDDKTFFVWKVPSFEVKKRLFTKNVRVLFLWYSKSKHVLEGICEYNDSYSILSWDDDGNIFKVVDIEEIIPDAFYKIEGFKEVVVAGKFKDDNENKGFNSRISFFNTYEQKCVRSFPVNGEIGSIIVSHDCKYFFLGQFFKIVVYLYSDLSVIGEIFAVNGMVQTMGLDNLTSQFYVFGNDEILHKIELKLNDDELYKEIDWKSYKLTDDESNVRKLTIRRKIKVNPSEENSIDLENNIKDHGKIIISENQQFIYFAYKEKFEIIQANSFALILSLDFKYVQVLTNLSNTLFLIREDGIDIYGSRSFQYLSSVNKKFTIQTAILSSDYQSIFFLTADGLIKMHNQLKNKSLTLLGDINHLGSFQLHIENLIKGNEDSVYFDSQWLIEPVHINLLHIYAYLNRSDLLKEAMEGSQDQTPIAFFNTSDNFSPLSVSLKMNFSECTHSIISCLRKRIKNDCSSASATKMLFQFIEENLVDLNRMGYGSLHKFYNDIFVIDKSIYLPNFCNAEFELPIIVKSSMIFPSVKEFGISEDNPDEGNSIVFRKSLLRMYTEMGSSKSIEFLKSLEDSKNEKNFETRIIRLILDEKWKFARWFIWVQAGIYVLYLIFLSFYNVYASCRTSWFLILPFIANFILYSYEVFFMFISFSEYFQEFWNVIDSIRSWLFIIYSILVWSDYFKVEIDKTSDERYLLSIIIFVSWLRGITYFRITRSTRYLIKLLFQVCWDILPFLFILFYSVIAFSLMFKAFDEDFNTSFFPFLTYSYSILLGNWDIPTSPNFYSLVLFLATILNPVISLNLLIAILSDTYETVNLNRVIADSQELASMILEVETLLFWKRNQNHKKYIHIAENDSVEDLEDMEYDTVIEKIKKKMFRFRKEFYKSDKTMKKFIDEVTSRTNIVKEIMSRFYN